MKSYVVNWRAEGEEYILAESEEEARETCEKDLTNSMGVYDFEIISVEIST